MVLELQAAYYDKRIAELISSVEKLDEELRHADIAGLADEYRARSVMPSAPRSTSAIDPCRA